MLSGRFFKKYTYLLLGTLVLLVSSGFGCRKEKSDSMFAPPTTPPPAESNVPAPPPTK